MPAETSQNCQRHRIPHVQNSCHNPEKTHSSIFLPHEDRATEYSGQIGAQRAEDLEVHLEGSTKHQALASSLIRLQDAVADCCFMLGYTQLYVTCDVDM